MPFEPAADNGNSVSALPSRAARVGRIYARTSLMGLCDASLGQNETIETLLGCRGNDALLSSSSTRSRFQHPEHPVVLAEPPQPPEFDANADLPSLASVALSGSGDLGATPPVEHKLPDPDRESSTVAHEHHVQQVGRRVQELAYSYPPPPALGSADETALPYPPSTPHLTRAPIEIATRDPAVGRGVFATCDIPAGEVIEISPVLVLGEEEYTGRKKGERNSDGELRGVEASQLRGYVFTWGRDGSMAVALGIGAFGGARCSFDSSWITMLRPLARRFPFQPFDLAQHHLFARLYSIYHLVPDRETDPEGRRAVHLLRPLCPLLGCCRRCRRRHTSARYYPRR